ncbi:MAG TPA: type II toxin-antitoxin system HicA family toxin [Candidatus Dormibacteraeota bacterium]|nr:type II toxin-antitoxin system HicA family toxin [Candidatus Dormibacteraeota bacterium]
MTRLPTDLSGQELVKILLRIGFVFQRQSGSHIILRRESPYGRVSVPNHKALRIGTLRTLLNEAGLTVEELIALR